jgi:hypothetical protein
MMRRRRYLQAAGLSLTGGLAGCSKLGGDASTPAATDTTTETATAEPTPTDEPTPQENPPDLDPPLWLNLIPLNYFGDEDEYTERMAFQRVDWEWYLQMRETTPEWGTAGNEIWSFAPTGANFRLVPSTDIVKTPHYGTLLTTLNIEDTVLGEFPTLGPEIERQCGLAADNDEREQTRIVNEVVNYTVPNVTIFIGVDTDAIHDTLIDNERQEYPNAAVTTYVGTDDAVSRSIIVSEEGPQGVVMVETGEEKTEELVPALRRSVDGRTESLAADESIQWCLSRAESTAPVVTGEVNGYRYEFAEQGRSDRSVERLEPFDTLVTMLDARQYSGTAQHVFSHVDGDPPTADELRESFETDSGEWTASSGPNVSSIEASWE